MCAALVERIAECAQKKPLVWLDHFAYSGRLLAGGHIPWLDAPAFVAYYRKAQSLLRPGVAMLPVDRFFDAWLSAHPALVAEMASKRRQGFALKTLLAAEAPRTVLTEIVKAVRESFASTPLVIAIPSPRRWFVWAHARANGLVNLTQYSSPEVSDRSAGAANPRAADAATPFVKGGTGSPPLKKGAANVVSGGFASPECGNELLGSITKAEPSADDVESAAMYVADFLRVFVGSHVDALLLEETRGHGPGSAEEVSWYQPVINVAKHYRWDIGIESLSTPFVPGPQQDIDFCIADANAARGSTSVVLGDAFWAGEAPPPLLGADFYFGRIPEDGAPEQVLERLATLW